MLNFSLLNVEAFDVARITFSKFDTTSDEALLLRLVISSGVASAVSHLQASLCSSVGEIASVGQIASAA